MISVTKGFMTCISVYSTFLPIKLLYYPHLLACLLIQCQDFSDISAPFHASLGYLGIRVATVIGRKESGFLRRESGVGGA